MMFTVIARPPEVLSKLPNFCPMFLHLVRSGGNGATLLHNRDGSANTSKAPKMVHVG